MLVENGLVDNRIEINDVATVIKPKGLGKRHGQAFLWLIGYGTFFALKTNMSVGIVAMTDNSDNTAFIAYDWDERKQGLILSSLFFGYIFSPLPASIIVKKYGAKIPLILSISILGILTILTATFADYGWQYLCISRIIQGLLQGFCFPCFHTLASRWVHPCERGILLSTANSGPTIGTLITILTSGFIASSKFGWPAIYYFSGGFAICWSIVLMAFCRNTPSDFKTISIDEKLFIESMPGSNINEKSSSIPWIQILTSKSYWGIQFAQGAECWSMATLLTAIPLYLHGTLQIHIKSNGLISAFPYLIMSIMVIVFSQLADCLLSHGYLSLVQSRKLFNTIGQWGPTFCLLVLANLPVVTPILSITLLSISMGLNGATSIGYFVNHIDISPNYAGSIVGSCQVLSNILTFLGPTFITYVVTDMTNPHLWSIVFSVTAVVQFVGNLFFILLAKAEVEKWN